MPPSPTRPGLLSDENISKAVVESLKREGFDVYILASITRDTRSLPEDTPRIFMSLNKAEFEPGPGRKLPQGFYSDYRLVYQSHFNLNSGLEEWRQKYGAGV